MMTQIREYTKKPWIVHSGWILWYMNYILKQLRENYSNGE